MNSGSVHRAVSTTKAEPVASPTAARPAWVDVDGGRLWAEAGGTGDSLLLIHGWALDHRMFARQMEALRASMNVIVYDRRGFGRSTAPPDLARELDDIDRILAHFRIADTHVLGMSQGGRIALRYAVSRPDRIRSLLLQGPAVDGLAVEEANGERLAIGEFVELARDGRLDEVKRRWKAHPMMALGAGFAEETRLIDRIVDDYSGRDLVDYRPEAYAFDVDVLARLGELDVPILLLTGAHETRARRAHARAILARARAGREVLFPDSGHLCNLTEPVRYNAEVLGFCGAAAAAN